MARISRQSFDPLYYQIERTILGDIQQGRLQSGDRLPGEKEIAVRFGVSRITARRVLEDLVTQGVAFSQQGRGTFVALPRTRELSGFISFSKDMRARGLQPSSRVLFFGEVDPPAGIARQLQMKECESAYLLKRVRLANGEPIVFETTYLPACLCPGLLTEDFATGSLYERLNERYGLLPTWADVEICATAATPEEAEVLRLQPGEPVLSADRLTYTKTFTVIEAVHSTNVARYSFYTGRQYIGSG